MYEDWYAARLLNLKVESELYELKGECQSKNG